jgi:hypothetical protein
MIVGRKSIIEYLRIPMNLHMDYIPAWRKIQRWRKEYKGFKKLFLYLPSGSVYIIRGEVEKFFIDYAAFKRGSRGDYKKKEQMST